MNPANGGWLIMLTLLLALLLSVVHLPVWLPGWTGWLRPAWVPVVLFFWAIHAPQRLNLIGCWLLGGVLDVLLSEPLGLNGMILATLTLVGWRLYERLRMYSVIQHAILLFVLVLGAELLRATVLAVALNTSPAPAMLVPPLISALCWPLVYGSLSSLTRNVRVE